MDFDAQKKKKSTILQPILSQCKLWEKVYASRDIVISRFGYYVKFQEYQAASQPATLGGALASVS